MLLNKSHAKKDLDHLSPDEPINSESGNQFWNYVINSRDTLNIKLQNTAPVPFAMTKDGNLFFMFQHSEAIEFKFIELIKV